MNKFFFLLLFIVTSSFAQKNGNEQTFVHRQDQKIIGCDGKELFLNGVNLGGWLLWEGWIWGGNFHSEERMVADIAKVTDRSYAEAFRDSVYASFITRDDIKAIAAMNLNSIRIPINHRMIDKENSNADIDEKNFKVLDSVISWCEEFNVYVILDLHALPGGQNNFFIADPDKVKLWQSEVHKQQAVKVWQAIAKHYAGKKIIAGYDLINEPNAKNSAELTKLYKRIIAGIRQVDNNHLLIVEGNKFAHAFDMFTELLDQNQIFSFHYYPWVGSEKGQLKKLGEYSAFGKKLNTAMWCGEWGEDQNINLDRIFKQLKSKDYNFGGMAFWTWKKVSLTKHASLNELQVSEDFKKIIKGQRPSDPTKAKGILHNFLTASKIGNTIPDKTLISILSAP
jgi:cellulase (glycosyl hydrolase family 5)